VLSQKTYNQEELAKRAALEKAVNEKLTQAKAAQEQLAIRQAAAGGSLPPEELR